MSQRSRRSRRRITPSPESVVLIKQPMVRDYSTHGGHLPGDELVEGARKTVTKKWQGYPPENLNVVGKSMPALAEVSLPRFTGKAQYASRVWFPDMLHARFLTSPHPHADPPYRHVSGRKDARGPRELNLQGEVVAIVVADTEDLADDAIEEIEVEHEVLPFVSTLTEAMSLGAPDLRGGQGNLIRAANAPREFPNVTWAAQAGDIDQGFAEADVIKELEYHFAGGVSVPMQPSGSVARWDGDKLTFWGMGQGIYPVRATLAAALGMDPANIRFINKWNGSTFGSARLAAERFYPVIAHLAKVTGRPVKIMLPKDQELAQLQIKPETITKFKIGAKNDGSIVALLHEVFVSAGDSESGYHASGPGNATNQLELYTSLVPHWRSTWSAYRTNAPRPGPSRSYYQQETKWSWEAMMDEMAETLGLDPLDFRMRHITRPKPGDDRYPYDSFPSVEVLTEGARVFGWENRNPKPGAAPGRFKRGVGVGMTQHHGGLMGYHEGEDAFATARVPVPSDVACTLRASP